MGILIGESNCMFSPLSFHPKFAMEGTIHHLSSRKILTPFSILDSDRRVPAPSACHSRGRRGCGHLTCARRCNQIPKVSILWCRSGIVQIRVVAQNQIMIPLLEPHLDGVEELVGLCRRRARSGFMWCWYGCRHVGLVNGVFVLCEGCSHP